MILTVVCQYLLSSLNLEEVPSGSLEVSSRLSVIVYVTMNEAMRNVGMHGFAET